MLRVTNTKNLTGVTIRGDYNDLEQLVQALHEITVSDYNEDLNKRSQRYINISLRVLGVCYDIRHASQGDRETFAEPNRLQDWKQPVDENGDPLHTLASNNVGYSCNVLYPEMILVTMALNDLVKHRMVCLAKSSYGFEAPLDKAVVWDRTIITVRMFQSAFLEAISQVLTGPALTRWLNIVHNRRTDVATITHPFVETWNLRYLDMNRDQRAKKLNTITKRFAEHLWDKEDRKYRRAIDQAMQEYQCAEGDLRTTGLDYPEEIEW
jgi:hypothetical protein